MRATVKRRGLAVSSFTRSTVTRDASRAGDPSKRRPTRRLEWRAGQRTEAGVSLILVLVLLVVGSLLVAGLITMASNDLLNSGNFAKVRSISYDASSAIDVAIQSIRYTPLLSPTETLNASPPAPCWPTATWPTGEPTSQLPNTGKNNFRVWCSTRWSPSSVRTRTVTLSACTEPSLTLPATRNAAKAKLKAEATSCAFHPLAQEVVSFDDYPPAGGPPMSTPCHTTCGSSMTVDSFVQHATMPTVTRLTCVPASASCASAPPSSPATVEGPIAGGATFTVSGTGFVKGSTVQFVQENDGAPAADDEILTGQSVDVRSSSLLTVTAPPAIEGSTYFVTVTTPAGTTAYGSADGFKYVSASPTVTRVCTGPVGSGRTGTPQTTCNVNSTSTNAQGAVSGGSELTIWGNNFYCPTSCTSAEPSVDFVSGAYVVPAEHVTVVAHTELSVTTPPEYKVTPAGPGTPKRAEFSVKAETVASSVAFAYVPIAPTANAVTYHSATKKVTITGTGFLTGDDTVAFIGSAHLSYCGSTTTTAKATSAGTVVDSSTRITAAVPTTLAAGKYFVTVTSKSAGTKTSTCYPWFTNP